MWDSVFNALDESVRLFENANVFVQSLHGLIFFFFCLVHSSLGPNLPPSLTRLIYNITNFLSEMAADSSDKKLPTRISFCVIFIFISHRLLESHLCSKPVFFPSTLYCILLFSQLWLFLCTLVRIRTFVF